MNNLLRSGLVIIVLVFITIIAGRQTTFTAEEHQNSLNVWFLNIGQGDSILLDTPDGHQILVDGGPDSSVLRELTKAMGVSDKEIDVVISTHNDADHLAGINQVLEHYQVDKVWLTGAVHTTQTYQTFIGLLKNKQIPTQLVQAGQQVSFGDVHGVAIWPVDSYNGVTPSQQNAAGIVTYWQYGQETMVLTADIEAPQEQEIVAKNLLRPVDILKVAHHGSKTSSSDAFLMVAQPKIAIISVGLHNKYGHPNQEILDRLASYHVPVLRTDQDGTIECVVEKIGYHCLAHR